MVPSNNILLLVVMLLLLLGKNVESQNTSFKLDAFTPHSLLLKYERDAFVPPDVPYVRLMGVNGTGYPRGVSVGRVLYKAPVNLWEIGKQASFETTITLQMTSVRNNYGHGMTFFIVPFNSTLPYRGGIGDNLGIYDGVVPESPIFAVEFDITSGFLDPPYEHIGININSQRSQNVTRLYGVMGQRLTAHITYDVPTRRINVVALYGSTTATVSFAFNLAALLPRQVHVGLSASTGYNFVVAYLDAYTWHFNSTMVPDPYGALGNNDTYVKQYVYS